MDKLSKKQKDEYATAFAILALYDGGVSAMKRGNLWRDDRRSEDAMLPLWSTFPVMILLDVHVVHV